jgi:hypothetical protein
MPGLLDMDKRTAMGLLMAGGQMMGGNRNALGSIGDGLNAFVQSLFMQDQLERERARQEKQDARQSRLDDASIAKDMAQVEHYKNQPIGGDPYWTTLDTPNGLVKFNTRTGEALPIELNGQTLMKSASDPFQQGAIAAAKQGVKPLTIDNPDGSKTTALTGQLFNMPTNNNIGNLRTLDGKGFQSFATPEEGQQALSRQIALYSTKHGIDNLLDFTSRYARKGDGNNDPVAYARFLSQQTGIPLDARGIDFSNPQINAAMSKAIPLMEQGWSKAGKPRSQPLEMGVVGGAGLAIQNGVPPKEAFEKAGQIVDSTKQALNDAKQGFYKGQSTADKLALETQAKLQQDQNKAGVELAQKQAEAQQKKTQSANNSLALLEQAEPLIETATNSGAGALMDDAMAFFGKSTQGANSAQALKALGANLVTQMPRMEGPQSDKDAQLYKEMAGQIADPWIPKARKMAALQTIKEIQTRYATPPTQQANGGWSIKAVE